MADVRVTQLIAEALSQPTPDTRVTQLIAEALSQPTPDVLVTQLIVEVMAIEPPPIELAGSPAGVSTVSGVLDVPRELAGTSSGQASVTGDLEAFLAGANLAGTPAGSATVSVALQQVHRLASASSGQASITGDLLQSKGGSEFPIPYQVGYGGATTTELSGVVSTGETSVTGTLSQVHSLAGSIAGDSSVEVGAGAMDYWWKFDETAGPTFFNTGLKAHLGGHAAEVGTLDASVAGVSNTGLGGFGSFKYAAIDPTEQGGDFFQVVDFTWAGWFFGDITGVPGGNQMLVDCIRHDSGFRIHYDPIDQFVATVRSGTGVIHTITYSELDSAGYVDVMRDSQWHHVALVVDSTNLVMKFYIDGSLVGERSLTAAIVYTASWLLYFGIRGEAGINEQWWAGEIDEYAWTPRVLTQSNVISLYNQGTPGEFQNLGTFSDTTVIDGTSTVTGLLTNAAVDGDGDIIIELEGTIAGVATVSDSGLFITNSFDSATNPPTFLYLQSNVGMGFEDADDASGRSDFVSQTYPDGDSELDFSRYLYLQVNVGFGFEDIDDASADFGFVSQIYPDGDTDQDFDRYLYHQIQVIEAINQGVGRLIVYPGIKDGKPFIPSALPPSGRFS